MRKSILSSIGTVTAIVLLIGLAAPDQAGASSHAERIKGGRELHDPGLHLFLDDDEVQDRPGFSRVVQNPTRIRRDPVLVPDRPWEGHAVQLWGSVLYDREEGVFKMWYFSANTPMYRRTGRGYLMCYATSKDGIVWEKPNLGLVPVDGSAANNVVYPTAEVPASWGLDPWGVVKDPDEPDPARRYKMGMYQQRPTGAESDLERPDMNREEKNRARKALLQAIRDRHGMYAAFSPDGIHWTLGEEILVPRGGDAGAMVYDPLGRQYLATTRRFGTIMDHFVVEWKRYRRVVALSTSKDFVHWTPLKTILKPDDLDHPRDQMYVMTPFAYGNQYIGFIGMLHSSTELGPTQLASARDLAHWRRVGRRQEFLPVGAPGSWDGAWSTPSGNPPVLKGNELYLWYSGRPQAHGTSGMWKSSIGVLTLRKDGFVALRSGIRGGDVMTEAVTVAGPKLYLNAYSFFGTVRIRVIHDGAVAPGYAFEDCNGLEKGDETDFHVTWGPGRKDLSAFVGEKVRLHIQSDNATSLFSYRFAAADD